MSDTNNRLDVLGSSIVNKPPVCYGTLPVAIDHCELFYGQGGSVRRLNLASASQDELELLTNSCSKATFGLNREDVLDESYRKAGKLDSVDFAMPFNAVQAGLLDVVYTELFEGKSQVRPIRAELYKLNVYGEGSFFKTHLDTPRDEAMFGSLVITFPTKHEGGALTFRHEGNEWLVDSGKLLAEQPEPCVVYAAFYSDVEHEVFPVQSGHRVTLTYNLYFGKDEPFSALVGNAIPVHGAALETTFANLLADPTFLPEGGCLGFGLRHQYPLNTSKDKDWKFNHEAKRAELQALHKYLKGGDAMLQQICNKLGLKNYLGIVYRDDDDEIMCNQVVDLDDDQTMHSEGLWNYLVTKYKVKMLHDASTGEDHGGWGRRVWWVTQSPRANSSNLQRYLAWGNEPQIAFTYFRVCLFVEMGKAGSRAKVDVVL